MINNTKDFVNKEFLDLNAKQRRATTREINRNLKTNPNYINNVKKSQKGYKHIIPFIGDRIYTDKFPIGYYHGQRKPGYAMTHELKTDLLLIKDSVLNRNDDFLMVIDGPVSTGKTTVSFQVALFLDPDFNLSKVCFTADQWLEAIENAVKGDCIVLDEAMLLMGRNALSGINKDVIFKLSQIRSKNLFLLFNLPSAFDIDRNIFLHRASTLLHTYTPEFMKKGYYQVYFEDEMKQLYIYGKKYYSYKKPHPNYHGNFSDCFVLDQEEYETKKQECIFDIRRSIVNNSYKERNLFIKYIRSLGKTYPEISKISNGMLGSNVIGKICRSRKDEIRIIKKEKGGDNDE